MEPKYSIVVATDPEKGTLFAKYANSFEDTGNIIYWDLMRLMGISGNEIALDEIQDGHGEHLLRARYDEGKKEVYYQVFSGKE